MIWLLFLPVRLVFFLLFGLLLVPLIILRGLLRLLGALILLPLVLVLTAVGLLVGGFMLVVPFLFLAFFGWMFVRLLVWPYRSPI